MSFCGINSKYEEAKLVIFGAPYDGTASFRPGSRFAPAQMRIDSWGLESYSPYQDSDLEDYAICDYGDIDLSFSAPQTTMAELETVVKKIVLDQKVPLMIGGEHSLTFPAVKAVFAKYPDLELIHLDAHTDLRASYLGDANSHASVMRRCFELLGPLKIHSFGVRSGLKSEFSFAKKNLDFHPFTLEGIEELRQSLGDKPVYLTLDLDILDPAYLMGTGTPEPGGVSFTALHQALLSLKGLNFKGLDLMELAPHYDSSAASTAVACKLLRELALIVLS